MRRDGDGSMLGKKHEDEVGFAKAFTFMLYGCTNRCTYTGVSGQKCY